MQASRWCLAGHGELRKVLEQMLMWGTQSLGLWGVKGAGGARSRSSAPSTGCWCSEKRLEDSGRGAPGGLRLMAWGGRREGLARCGSELEWEGGGGQAPGEQAVEEQEGLGGKRASGGIRKAEVCGQGAPGGGALGDSAPEGGQTDRRRTRETRWEEG